MLLRKLYECYINQDLKQYIENNIFSMYNRYYSHGMLHINIVIKKKMEQWKKY